MKKILCFLMVGLAFTALQVVTVGAQTGAPGTAPMGAPGTDHMGAPGTAPMGAPGTDHMGAPGTAPMGDTPHAPSIGERVKSFFGMGTEAPPTGAPGTAPMGDPSCAPLANGTLPPHCK